MTKTSHRHGSRRGSVSPAANCSDLIHDVQKQYTALLSKAGIFGKSQHKTLSVVDWQFEAQGSPSSHVVNDNSKHPHQAPSFALPSRSLAELQNGTAAQYAATQPLTRSKLGIVASFFLIMHDPHKQCPRPRQPRQPRVLVPGSIVLAAVTGSCSDRQKGKSSLQSLTTMNQCLIADGPVGRAQTTVLIGPNCRKSQPGGLTPMISAPHGTKIPKGQN